mgnify:CR=1 FL=1
MSHAKHRQIREICEIRGLLKTREIRGLQESFDYAALHAEGAGDGGEDGDDEVDDGLDVLFFHCCGGFDGYTILWWVMVHNLVMGLMVTQSGEKGYGRSEQVPVHDGVSLVLAGVITPVEFVV